MCKGVYMINPISANIKQNSYGNIERAGNLPNGRVLYNVIDSEGQNAGKLSVPQEQTEVFEQTYKNILDIAPKIRAYVDANSSNEAIRKRRNMSRTIVGTCGLIGTAVPLIILRKSTSMTKKILGAVTGIVSGIAVGFVASLGVSTPPGSLEFAKARRTLSDLDIQPIFDEKV